MSKFSTKFLKKILKDVLTKVIQIKTYAFHEIFVYLLRTLMLLNNFFANANVLKNATKNKKKIFHKTFLNTHPGSKTLI